MLGALSSPWAPVLTPGVMDVSVIGFLSTTLSSVPETAAIRRHVEMSYQSITAHYSSIPQG